MSALSVLLAACLIISLFLATLLRLNAGHVIMTLFISCLTTLVFSIIEFIRDINQTLTALKLEVRDSVSNL